MEYLNAQQAFEKMYEQINTKGSFFEKTKTIFNVGFYILNPLDNLIKSPFRNWSEKYALREWEWYCSENPSALEISKHAPIWKKHMDSKGEVRSNYGWQLSRFNQLNEAIEKIRKIRIQGRLLFQYTTGKK